MKEVSPFITVAMLDVFVLIVPQIFRDGCVVSLKNSEASLFPGFKHFFGCLFLFFQYGVVGWFNPIPDVEVLLQA
jgi:hypothetical protein